MIVAENIADERGFFARTFCRREFQEHGLVSNIAQCSISSNRRGGTLRGMHYQIIPCAEEKLVRCTKGAVYDVTIDLRPDSPMYCRWFGLELTAANRIMLYVPQGVAHGFLTLVDETEIFYQISQFYSPEHQRGVRWNDPRFKIKWPMIPQVISDRDAGYPDFRP